MKWTSEQMRGLSYTNNSLYLCCQELDYNYVKVHLCLILKAFVNAKKVHSVIVLSLPLKILMLVFVYSNVQCNKYKIKYQFVFHQKGR